MSAACMMRGRATLCWCGCVGYSEPCGRACGAVPATQWLAPTLWLVLVLTVCGLECVIPIRVVRSTQFQL